MKKEDKAVLINRYTKLLDVLNTIDLDDNWLLSVTALASQEVAIKKRLYELG